MKKKEERERGWKALNECRGYHEGKGRAVVVRNENAKRGGKCHGKFGVPEVNDKTSGLCTRKVWLLEIFINFREGVG